jgi:predicted nucleotidyltransferase
MPGWRDDAVLAEACRRIAAAVRPARIYLFGSRAWGRPGPDSDYDLLVVVSDAGADERRLQGHIATALWGLPAAFDVLVRTRAWWDEWSDTPCSLEERIANEGIVLQDALDDAA